jgi:Fe-coproporphyrin III synthase
MIGVSKLLCGTTTPHDVLRYGRESARMPAHLLQFSKDKRPVVVWNTTRRCNLHCVHCYASADGNEHEGELTTVEAKTVIDDLASFGAPVLLFSGGEPLLREDLCELGRHAVERGLRTVISTNGTLINRNAAGRIKEAGFSYVGVSLDGIDVTNDRFRGQKGAFGEALAGIRACREAGVRTGLRFTINRRNQGDLPAVLDLMVEENIPRCCVYHLVYAGRGSRLVEEDLSHEEARRALDIIFGKAQEFHRRGLNKEVLTVDNHADGVYLYQRVRAEQPERAEEVYRLLSWNGGNSSGIGIGCIDDQGNVHADQFWRHHSFGNVRERPFSDIWLDTSDPVMRGLKDRKALIKGRCATCRYLDVCNANFRVRAEAVTGDIWQADPACYLTDAEIAAGSGM